MLRLDHQFSPGDSVYLRFNFDASYSDVPLVEGCTYLNDRQLIASRPVNGELEWSHIFSPSLVNELKFGFNRGNVYTTDQSTLRTPYADCCFRLHFARPETSTRLGVGNTFSYIDNLTWIKGAHTVKSGVEMTRIQLNQGNTPNGTITFSSAANFENNSVSSAATPHSCPSTVCARLRCTPTCRMSGNCVPT